MTLTRCVQRATNERAHTSCRRIGSSCRWRRSCSIFFCPLGSAPSADLSSSGHFTVPRIAVSPAEWLLSSNNSTLVFYSFSSQPTNVGQAGLKVDSGSHWPLLRCYTSPAVVPEANALSKSCQVVAIREGGRGGLRSHSLVFSSIVPRSPHS